MSKLSIVQSCKNRNINLVNSINSYINNDKIDDIVVVDFNSENNIKCFLDKEIQTNLHKITVIEIVTEIPYIASWSNNIGLYFAKNNTILKLDADNIILDQTFINELDFDNMDNNMLHVDWRDNTNENETHLNGVFICTKNDLKKFGYHNQQIISYGYEDCEIKRRFENNKVKMIKLNPSFFYHQEQTDKDRLINQSNISWTDFYGFNLKNINRIGILTFYNTILNDYYPQIINEEDLLKIFNILETNTGYIKIDINNIIERSENTNYNPLNISKLSCSKIDIFKIMYNNNFWFNSSDILLIFYKKMLTKYNIQEEKDMVILFYILQSNYTESITDLDEITIKEQSTITDSLNILYETLEDLKKKRVILDCVNTETSIIYDVLHFLEIDTIQLEYIFLTIVSILENCDEYIDNYINTLTNLKGLENQFLIISNIYTTNSDDTNNKIDNFCKDKKNITLILKDTESDINNLLNLVSTELVTIYNQSDKLHPDFINIYINEFKNNKNLNLIFCPLYLSESLLDTFENNLPLLYDKKKIFVRDYKDLDYDNYVYKNNLMLDCLNPDLDIITKTMWINYSEVDIFDFFRIDGDNFADLNNYNLFTFPGRSCVWKIEMFKKYGGFDIENYEIASDIELWLRYFQNTSKIINNTFKKHDKSYVIHYTLVKNKELIKDFEVIKRTIIKKYHPIFKYIDTNFDVIIPYRDRQTELEMFKESFNNSYKIYFDYNIIVSEQNSYGYFNRGKMINEGIKQTKSKKVLITDVDLLFKKIHLDFIKIDSVYNYKLYGLHTNRLSIGGGAFLMKVKDFEKIYGFSDKYEGWGSEDMDITYRIHFENVKINFKNMIDRDTNDKYTIDEIRDTKKEDTNRVKYCDKNNIIFIQQVLNYNLIFYYENISLFLFFDKKIYFEDSLNNHNLVLFFEGDYDLESKQLKYGKLFDLVSSNNNYPSYFITKDTIIIYSGFFINGLPTGLGCGYNLWYTRNNNLTGYWLNGYLYEKIDIDEHDKYIKDFEHSVSTINKNTVKQVNIQDENDFVKYKDNVKN